jgi:hypothetical protein
MSALVGAVSAGGRRAGLTAPKVRLEICPPVLIWASTDRPAHPRLLFPGTAGQGDLKDALRVTTSTYKTIFWRQECSSEHRLGRNERGASWQEIVLKFFSLFSRGLFCLLKNCVRGSVSDP